MEACTPLIGAELYLRRLGTTGTVIATHEDQFLVQVGTAQIWVHQRYTAPVRKSRDPEISPYTALHAESLGAAQGPASPS
jgi:hypothetical protein